MTLKVDRIYLPALAIDISLLPDQMRLLTHKEIMIHGRIALR